jgi:hypothetical protein
MSLISNPLICFHCFLLGKKTVLALYYQFASKTKKMCGTRRVNGLQDRKSNPGTPYKCSLPTREIWL